MSGVQVPANRWDVLDGLWPQEPPRVSAIVCHFEQHASLERTLAALAAQDHPAERLEVVVVDDGSKETPSVPDGVVLVAREDVGYRVAEARNEAVAASTGDILCFFDADTAPEPGYVRRMTRLPALAPDVLTVGCRRYVDHATGRVLPSPQWLEQGYVDTRDLLDVDDRSYRFVISAVAACSRALFDEIGGFDASIHTYGGEDWDWAHRAWLAGGVLAHVGDAVAWHDGPAFDGRFDDVARRRAKNAETLALTGRIAVAGSRPLGVRTVPADVEVVLASAPGEAAAFVCVDSVLAELAESSVVVPPDVARPFAADGRVATATRGGARVVVELPRPVRVRPRGLRVAVDRVGREGLGAVVLLGDDGEPLARVVSQRAAARAARWGTAEGFESVELPADGLTPLDEEPDVEAHVGGWA